MNWDDLRFFAALVRHGNLSAAARELRTDHSTVARRIDSLEKALTLKLFERLPRGYVLTVEGQRLAERLGPLEDAIFSIQRIEGSDSVVEGQVRISAPPALASLWLVPRLMQLRRAHPGLVIDIVGATGAANLVRREADIALRMWRPEEGALTIRKLGTLRYGLYGAPDYLNTVDAKDWVFLAYSQDLEGSPQQLWLRDFTNGRPSALLSNDLVSLISAAKAGMGLAALPHVLAEDDLGLACATKCEGVERELWLAYHPDIGRSARIRVVLDQLVEITQRLRL